jgi:hypothetical protein
MPSEKTTMFLGIAIHSGERTVLVPRRFLVRLTGRSTSFRRRHARYAAGVGRFGLSGEIFVRLSEKAIQTGIQGQ